MVIASQCAHWRGNPPMLREYLNCFEQKELLDNGGSRKFSNALVVCCPKNEGVATPV